MSHFLSSVPGRALVALAAICCLPTIGHAGGIVHDAEHYIPEAQNAENPGGDVAPTPPAESDPTSELPTEPLGVLEGQPNFRDLGGYETADGRRIKRGEVYRSGELSHLTDEDVAVLVDLEIQTVVNFLLPQEIERNGTDRLPEGVFEDLQPVEGEKAAEQTMVVTAAIKSAEFDRIPREMNPGFHRLLE